MSPRNSPARRAAGRGGAPRGRGGQRRGRGGEPRGRGGRRGTSKQKLTKQANSSIPYGPDDQLEFLNSKGEVVAAGSVFYNLDGERPDKIHGHTLRDLEKLGGKPDEQYVIVRLSQLVESHKKDPFPYKLLGPEVPKILGNLVPVSNYVWDVKKLRRVPCIAESSPSTSSKKFASVSGSTSYRDSSKAVAAQDQESAERPEKPVRPTGSAKTKVAHQPQEQAAECDPENRLVPQSSLQAQGKIVRRTGSAKSKASQQPIGYDTEDPLIAPPLPNKNRAKDPTEASTEHQKGLKKPAGVESQSTKNSNSTAPKVPTADLSGIDEGTMEKDPAVEDDSENLTDEEVDNMPSTVADEDDVIVGEEYSGESEEVGDEIKVPYEGSRETYNTDRIRIRIDQLVYPPNVIRDLDRRHVGLLKASLREGIHYSLGHIAVCHKPSAMEFTRTRHPEEKFEGLDVDEKPVTRHIDGKDVSSLQAYYVINGMHRGNAIDRLFIEADSPPRKQEYGVIYVLLFSRKDGKEMTFYELLAIGGSENDIEAVVRKPPTFADQVRLAVSCAKELIRLNPGASLTYVGIGSTFTSHNIIYAKHKETHRKYAQCALTLIGNPELYQMFQVYWDDGEPFRIGHFQCSIFHNKFSNSEQVVVLSILHHFLKEKKRKKSARHFSSTAAKNFYMECRALYDVVDDFAKIKNTTSESLLRMDVAITKDQSVSVQRLFSTTITSFSPTLSVVQMAPRTKARVKRFRATLANTFTPQTEEEKNTKALEDKKKKEDKRKQQETRKKLARVAKTNAIAVASKITAAERSQPSTRTGKRKRKDASGPPNTRAKFASDPDLEYIWTNNTVKPFDDEVPAQYPKGFGSRPPKWKGSTAWVQLLTVPPHRLWGEDLSVKHAECWLHGMGVPRKHRAHIFLTCQDLQRNHHAVYFHAALQAAKLPVVLHNSLYDAPGVREDKETRATRIAKEHPDLSEQFLVHCRENVTNKGYCVIEGIFDDRRIADGPEKTVYDEQPAQKVVDFYVQNFPSDEELKKGNVRNKYWSAIFNNSTTIEEDVQKSAQGRFTTHRSGLFENTERNVRSVHISKYRAALDVRAMQICVSMGLEVTGMQMLAIPCTGSRLSTNTSNCERQIAHSDFQPFGDGRDTLSPRPNVDYSVKWTGEDSFPIILWENSHILQCGTPALSKKIADSMKAKRVVVPPFSCIIFRGDLLHCGPGWQDYSLEERQAQRHALSIRFHMYIIRWGMGQEEREKRITDAPVVPNSVYFIDKFQPTVQLQPYWTRPQNE